MLKSQIQLPADAGRDQPQFSEVSWQGLAIPHQQDPSVGLGMSSGLLRSQLVCGPRELLKHFGTVAGGSHSSGEHWVSAVRSGCSNCQTRVRRKHSSFGACSHPLGCTGVLAWEELQHTGGWGWLGGRVSAGVCMSSQVRGVCMYLAYSSCVNLGGTHGFARGAVSIFVCS